ncbi:myosin-1 isoform X3, partial [Paramuricea clavata]
VNTEVCRQFGITRSLTSAYHPQTNGLDERTNQTLKVPLAKLVNEHQNNWDDFLEEVAFSIRTQKQDGKCGKEDGIFELETPSSEILEEMTYDRSEMMNCVDQQPTLKNPKQNRKKILPREKTKGSRFSSFQLVTCSPQSYEEHKPQRIVEIDHHQRVSLAKLNGDVLNVKVPYEQIKPHTASVLHKPKSSPAVPQEPRFEEIKAKEVEEEPCQSTGQTDTN